MGVDTRAQELDPGLNDEVAGEALPHELELVPRTPEVHARGGQRVLLGEAVVGGGAGDPGRANVPVALELAEAAVRSRGGGAREGEGQGDDEARRAGPDAGARTRESVLEQESLQAPVGASGIIA